MVAVNPTPTLKLKSPYVYFGGKSRAASLIWSRLGTGPDAPGNYVEPFAGSIACLLARPGWSGTERWTETVNDVDVHIVNFWRALQADPDGLAALMEYPISESDVTARHRYLVDGRSEEHRQRIVDDPHYFDLERAAWWCWGAACWIGSGWCATSTATPKSKLPHVVMTPRTSHRRGVCSTTPPGSNLPTISMGKLTQNGARGVQPMDRRGVLHPWMQALAARTRHVRIVCGDWCRIVRHSVTTAYDGITAVVLDPPYDGHERVYSSGRRKAVDPAPNQSLSAQCRQWCQEHGNNPKYRIALCGYGDEHDELLQLGWTVESWTANGGYGNMSEFDNANRHRERIWFSPHCLGGVRESVCNPTVVEDTQW